MLSAISIRSCDFSSGGDRLGKVLIAPFDVILSPHDVFQPDVMFVSNERLHLRTGDDIRGRAGFVVEVLSPSTAHQDRVGQA